MPPTHGGPVRGVVFDLDGTLVDNMELHERAFAAFGERHRLPALDAETELRLRGTRNTDIFPALFRRELTRDEVRAYSVEKEALYRELSKGGLVALAGLDRLLLRLEAQDIPAVIATSGPAENVEHTLREIGLTSRLTSVVRGDMVARGKPHPDIFLAAAARIGVPPGTCLAFEDTPAGVQGAQAAGMTTVAITTSLGPEVFAAAGLHTEFMARDFDEFLSGPGARLLGPLPGDAEVSR
jgi:HAD superfamily hydrolase (TIGR01509 family)